MTTQAAEQMNWLSGIASISILLWIKKIYVCYNLVTKKVECEWEEKLNNFHYLMRWWDLNPQPDLLIIRHFWHQHLTINQEQLCITNFSIKVSEQKYQHQFHVDSFFAVQWFSTLLFFRMTLREDLCQRLAWAWKDTKTRPEEEDVSKHLKWC